MTLLDDALAWHQLVQVCTHHLATGPCGQPAPRRWLPGWRCPNHTPNALAGLPEIPPSDPALTAAGLAQRTLEPVSDHQYGQAPARLLVTGSRDWEDVDTLRLELANEAFIAHNPDLVIVHGACPTGADRMADDWARDTGYQVERHPADWKQGKGAGFARNATMVDQGAAVCLAFIKDNSPGATHCARLAEQSGIYVRRFTA